VRLADELVHLGVGRKVDDEVDDRVLDAADAAGKRRVVPGEILQESREASVQGFCRLSTPNTS
jgi:hypothetical protein